MLHRDSSNELNTIRFKRKTRKKVQEERIARGYVAKKQTTKEEYLKTKES